MATTSWDAAGVRLELAGALASVVLTRPERRNAQTPHTWAALAEIGAQITGSSGSVRVVVVRGEGASFSAGLDRALFTAEGLPGLPGVAALGRRPAVEADAVIDRYQDGFRWLRSPGIVSIAAVQGYAIGAGFQLALACDLRVLAQDAQLCMAETSLGLVPDLTGTKPLVDLVGYSRALEICLTGRRVGAAEAAAIGLATVVVPGNDLEAAVGDLVSALLAAPAGAVRDTTELLRGAAGRSAAEQEAAERVAQIRRLQQLAQD